MIIHGSTCVLSKSAKMPGPTGIAIIALLIVGACIRLALTMRGKYTRSDHDAEKDADIFAPEVKVQLQSELDEAVRSSTTIDSPWLGEFQEDWSSISRQTTTFPMKSIDNKSITGSFGVSKAADQHLPSPVTGTSQTKIKTTAAPNDTISSDHVPTSDPGQFPPPVPQRQGPGQTADDPLYVNAKQFIRILKRRMERQKLEEYFRSRPKQPPRKTPAYFRRPRGPGGRFLTEEEISQMVAAKLEGGGVGNSTIESIHATVPQGWKRSLSDQAGTGSDGTQKRQKA